MNRNKSIPKGFLILTIAIFFLLNGCSEKIENEWDCSVNVPANSQEITFSDQVIKTGTGELSIQNRNNIDITWYLYETSDKENPVEEMTVRAGGFASLLQLSKDKEYCVGFRADVTKDSLLKIIITDYQNTNPFALNCC